MKGVNGLWQGPPWVQLAVHIIHHKLAREHQGKQCWEGPGPRVFAIPCSVGNDGKNEKGAPDEKQCGVQAEHAYGEPQSEAVDALLDGGEQVHDKNVVAAAGELCFPVLSPV